MIIQECKLVSVPVKRANGRIVETDKIKIPNDVKVFVNESITLFCLIIFLQAMAKVKFIRSWAFWSFTILSLTILTVWCINLIIHYL